MKDSTTDHIVVDATNGGDADKQTTTSSPKQPNQERKVTSTAHDLVNGEDAVSRVSGFFYDHFLCWVNLWSLR